MNKIKDIIRRYNTGSFYKMVDKKSPPVWFYGSEDFSLLLYFSLLYKVYLYQFPLALERKDRMLYRKHIDEVSTSPATD